MAKAKPAQQAANSSITQANNSSFTVWSPQDTVRDVAESLGISNISDDVLRSLAMDVEYRILEIIEQAVKFKRHSKRETLTSDDISKSLKVLNVEPLYGYAPGVGVQSFSKTQVGLGSQQQNLYCLNDEEVDFDQLINEPLPPAPRLPSFTAHWLAVEGVQPFIPQNPNLTEIRHKYPPMTRGAIVTSVNENSLQTIIPDEEILEETSEKTNGNGEAGPNGQTKESQVTTSKIHSSNVSKITKSIIKPGVKELEVKPRVKHVLSKELQIYFEKVCTALLSPNSSAENTRMRTAALHSLKNDTGLHQLVPYFISFISEQITYNLDNLNVLATILEIMYSLLCNESIFLDPYIHTLMPSILTLLLAKTLGTEENQLDQTLGLRDFASELMHHVLEKFPKLEKHLKPRLTRTLLKSFLDTNRTMGTYYGCFKGVMVLGPETVRFFMGNLYNWAELVLPVESLVVADSNDAHVDIAEDNSASTGLEASDEEVGKDNVVLLKEEPVVEQTSIVNKDDDVHEEGVSVENKESADEPETIQNEDEGKKEENDKEHQETDEADVNTEKTKQEEKADETTVNTEQPETIEDGVLAAQKEETQTDNKQSGDSKDNEVVEESVTEKQPTEESEGRVEEEPKNTGKSEHSLQATSESTGDSLSDKTNSNIQEVDKQDEKDAEGDVHMDTGTEAALTTDKAVDQNTTDLAPKSVAEKTTSKFTPEETQHLIEVVIVFLKSLETELPDLQQKPNEPLTETEKSKLQSIVGSVIATTILNFESVTETRKLYDAIFFGDLDA